MKKILISLLTLIFTFSITPVWATCPSIQEAINKVGELNTLTSPVSIAMPDGSTAYHYQGQLTVDKVTIDYYTQTKPTQVDPLTQIKSLAPAFGEGQPLASSADSTVCTYLGNMNGSFPKFSSPWNQVVVMTTTQVDNIYLTKPTGDYSVGFQDFRLVDGTLNAQDSYVCPGKTDMFYIKGQNEADFGKDNQIDFCRETMIRVYYPTQYQSTPQYANYYLPAINDLQSQIRAADVPNVTESDIAVLAKIKSFSIDNPGIVAVTFPVLLFSPGAGTESEIYENIITNLVSHGYIVVGINNTFIAAGVAFPDGRIVHYPNSIPVIAKLDQSVLHDILFVRQELETDTLPIALRQHMDFKNIGLFGHSIGGISTVQAIRENAKLFNAAISYDATPVAFGTRTYSPTALAGFSQTPFLRFFAAEWRQIAPTQITPPDAQFQLLNNNYYALLAPNENNHVPFYTNHMSFSDFSTLQYQPTIQKYIMATGPNGLGSANGWHITNLVNAYTLQFFDMYLKKQPSAHYQNCQIISLDGIEHDTMLKCGKAQLST